MVFWDAVQAGLKASGFLVLEKKKRKDYAFRRQIIEKPSITPGCPAIFGVVSASLLLPMYSTCVWLKPMHNTFVR